MGTPARLPAIDMLRGFVIALMALDHTRDFFGITPFSPEDLAATTPAWFWTRWITHLCATVFVLLAGSSAFLRGQARGVRSLSGYLTSRGALLILLEATWISYSWQFGYNVVILFAVLRFTKPYGDPGPWSAQGRGPMFDLMSFVRVHKYPPSLLYLCVTGSIGLALLVLFERVRNIRMLILFGSTPMFFYVVHIALIHFLGNAYLQLRFGGLPDFAGGRLLLPPGYEPSLAVVYLAWGAMLALMVGLTLLWRRWRAAAPLATPAQAPHA